MSFRLKNGCLGGISGEQLFPLIVAHEVYLDGDRQTYRNRQNPVRASCYREQKEGYPMQPVQSQAPTIETCPVCGVRIEGGARVLFSAGPSGTRARLWARVCNYAQSPDCINQDDAAIGNVSSRDYYN